MRLAEAGNLCYVSIHAPTRGATISKQDKEWTKLGFNSRAHKGRDSDVTKGCDGRAEVSIHAPTRGATMTFGLGQATRRMFQFTRPQGARLGRTIERYRRTHVSIHAPTRGATYYSNSKIHSIMVSIHAPTRGATSLQMEVMQYLGFNSRAHKGRDNWLKA